VASNVPSDLDDGVTQNGLSTTITTNGSVAHERRKHHRSLRLEETSSTTLLETITCYSSISSWSSYSQLLQPTILHTSLPSSINLTFLSRPFDSRASSKLLMHFHMNATASGTPLADTCATALSTPTDASRALHLAAISAIVSPSFYLFSPLCTLLYGKEERLVYSDSRKKVQG
jgi:hypothetical protein